MMNLEKSLLKIAFVLLSVFLFSFQIFSKDANSDLVLCWSFDKENSKMEKDISGNGYDGVIAGEIKWIDGVSGKALMINGKYGTVVSEKCEEMNNKKITVMFWIKPVKWAKDGNIIVNKGWAGGWGIDPRYYGENIHLCACIDKKRKDAYVKTSFPMGKWSHIAFSYDGKTMRLFVNGVERKVVSVEKEHGKSNIDGWKPKGSFCGELNSDGAFLQIGGLSQNVSGIDELKIFSRPLGAAEIRRMAKPSWKGALLTRNGKASSVILADENCPPATIFAANELRDFIEKISGAKIPVLKLNKETDISKLKKEFDLIFVGDSKAARDFGFAAPGKKPDEFIIETRQGAIFIAGNDDRRAAPLYVNGVGSAGTIYGVYRLLNELGVRWFFPGETGEVLPKIKDVKFAEGFKISSAPYFQFRYADASAGMDGLWLRRIGFGSSCLPGSTWHSFRKLAALKLVHPEWFALRKDGKHSLCLCASRDDVRRQAVKEAVKHFKKTPGDLYPDFTVMENDGERDFCHCERCGKLLTPEEGRFGIKSDYWADVAVEMANAVKDEFPDRRIVIGAYNQQLRPPIKIKTLPSNVSVQIAKQRFHFWSQETQDRAYNEIIGGWMKLKPAAIGFWEYYNFDCWGGGKWFGIPAVATEMIARDIRKLREMSEKSGIKFLGEYIFSNGRAGSNRKLYWLAPDCYVTAKFLWNPDASLENIMADFYGKYFGPAAKEMKDFYSEAEKVWNQGGSKWGKNGYALRKELPKGESFFERNPWDLLFTPEVLKRLDESLKKAEKKGCNEPYKSRIKMIGDGFNITLSLAAKNRKAKTSDEEREKANALW
jgi:hypothetical protein